MFWNKYMGRYELKIGCRNCKKESRVKIPIGIDAKEANLPCGLYLYDGNNNYRKLNGEIRADAEYIICSKCGSKQVFKKPSKEGI